MKKFILIFNLFFCLILLSGCSAINPKFDTPEKDDDNINSRCGIENCHGLDIKCGSNIAEICTEIYEIGDRCRQYAICELVNGECKLIENTHFKECKTCVQNCIDKFKNAPEQFSCESNC